MKVKIILFSLIFIFVVTFIANGLLYSGGHGIDTVPSNVDPSFFGVVAYIDTYWKLVTFSIPGMPFLFSIVFIIINLLVLWVIIIDVILPLLQSDPWVVIIASLSVLISLLVTWIWNIIGGLEGIESAFESIGQALSDIGKMFDWGWW